MADHGLRYIVEKLGGRASCESMGAFFCFRGKNYGGKIYAGMCTKKWVKMKGKSAKKLTKSVA